MPQNYQQMTEENFNHLMRHIHEGNMGDESVYACTAQPADHLHARRLGPKEAGADVTRIGVMAHSAIGVASVLLSASDARSLAETLLSLAEEADGMTTTYDIPDDVSALIPEPDEGDE